MRARANAWRTRDQGSAFVEERRRQYVDELIDGYVSWREACVTVAVSYENWRCSDRPDEKLAFNVYFAALDREERAAAAYRRSVGQVATALAGRQSSSLLCSVVVRTWDPRSISSDQEV